MADIKQTQFRLSEDGVISYQAQETNPLPGIPIAKLIKGKSILRPEFKMIGAAGFDAPTLENWFQEHLKTVVEPLAALQNENTFKAPTKEIIDQVHNSLGIIPREKLEDIIVQLDEQDRRDLRALKIRLGPILIFIPALNKPAAIRLRAMLWSLHNNKELPANVPNDGIVSCAVNSDTVCKDFYQSIGYPVYNSRAIRIDMLDRVICAVYDAADKGKFQATHNMAEWLGCGIEDLYKILEAMGHKRIIEDPATTPNQIPEQTPKDKTKPEGQKPNLDWFSLKRGKAFEKPGESKPTQPHKPKQTNKKSEKPKGKRNKTTNRAPKIMSAEAKINPDDSPFAVLQQLKK